MVRRDESESVAALAARLQSGDLTALARCITMVEQGSEFGDAVTDSVFTSTGRATVVGVTGPPGVGKSTMVDQLVSLARSTGSRVAVLAVDPSSPTSGGALLGDRVRMRRHATDVSVFMRSVASRGDAGGLSPACRTIIRLMDAAGFDLVLVETVGTGQVELDVVTHTDCALLLVAPGLGDLVQAIKSGLLDVVDVIAVNRRDDGRAEATARELRTTMQLRGRHLPDISLTSAVTGEGVAELWDTIRRTVDEERRSGRLEARRQRRQIAEMKEHFVTHVVAAAYDGLDAASLRRISQQVSDGVMSPRRGALEMVRLTRADEEVRAP